MSYRPHYSCREMCINIEDVVKVLVEKGVIPESAIFQAARGPCYCENPDFCNCPPTELVFELYEIMPNACPRCGASGEEMCCTPSGRRLKSYHKERKYI